MSQEPELKSAAEVMPSETADLFTKLRGNPLLHPFFLIGGTALSLHIGHRVSEDLDLYESSMARKLLQQPPESGMP